MMDVSTRKKLALTYIANLKAKGIYSFEIKSDQVEVIESLRQDGEWIQINEGFAEIMPDFPLKDAAIKQVLDSRLNWENMNVKIKIN